MHDKQGDNLEVPSSDAALGVSPVKTKFDDYKIEPIKTSTQYHKKMHPTIVAQSNSPFGLRIYQGYLSTSSSSSLEADAW